MKQVLLLIALLCSYGYAQDTVDTGFWNDFQFTKPATKSADVVLGVRFDTKRNWRSFAEQRVYGAINFKKGRFLVQPGVIFLKNFSRIPYYEIRPQLTLQYKFTVNKVNITPRVRMEYHEKLNLPNAGRIVPVISIDKKVSKRYAVFNTDEFWIPIHNPKDVAKFRKRLFFGITRTVNPHLSVDVFYLYQRDEQVNPKNSHKIGLTWKVR